MDRQHLLHFASVVWNISNDKQRAAILGKRTTPNVAHPFTKVTLGNLSVLDLHLLEDQDLQVAAVRAADILRQHARIEQERLMKILADLLIYCEEQEFSAADLSEDSATVIQLECPIESANESEQPSFLSEEMRQSLLEHISPTGITEIVIDLFVGEIENQLYEQDTVRPPPAQEKPANVRIITPPPPVLTGLLSHQPSTSQSPADEEERTSEPVIDFEELSEEEERRLAEEFGSESLTEAELASKIAAILRQTAGVHAETETTIRGVLVAAIRQFENSAIAPLPEDDNSLVIQFLNKFTYFLDDRWLSRIRELLVQAGYSIE